MLSLLVCNCMWSTRFLKDAFRCLPPGIKEKWKPIFSFHAVHTDMKTKSKAKSKNKNKTFFVWCTHSLRRSYIPDDIYSYASVAGKLINISINVLTTSSQESGSRRQKAGVERQKAVIRNAFRLKQWQIVVFMCNLSFRRTHSPLICFPPLMAVPFVVDIVVVPCAMRHAPGASRGARRASGQGRAHSFRMYIFANYSSGGPI